MPTGRNASLLTRVYNALGSAQAARLAHEQVEAAVTAAEEGFREGNTLEATAKAAVAAWRSAQVWPLLKRDSTATVQFSVREC